MDDDFKATCHLLYLALSVGATVYVGRTLHKHGRLFLVDTFAGNGELAEAVNHLLVVGFYLVNIGWVGINTADSARPEDLAAVIEILGRRIGEILLMLGGMHFFNLFVFSRIRRRALLPKAPPPVFPAQVIAPPRPAATHWVTP